MYRSSGELRKYAQCVFALYCLDDGLSISRFRLAWYVLWGKWPEESVVHMLFDKKDKSTGGNEGGPTGEENEIVESDVRVEENRHNVGGTPLAQCFSFSAPPRRINEKEFVRFAVTYHDTMGADAVGFGDAEEDGEYDMVDMQSAFSGVARACHWPQFHSLAGSKGYVTLDDFVAAEKVDWLCRPMSGGSASGLTVEQAGDDSSTTPQDDDDRRLAVLSHVFAIIDSDRDGRLNFGDVARHLAKTA
ncbi:hypothetical protein MOQ_004456 [Trypanosoma cruzi marinkellei]|uniref:EF-hand domain-containing protein n=1 Tax=Trypanosoma cruzi marinkellei TaxID=85056 RepID=K2N160_TRYCR|nr:hypothetical protein MOQ_004456 [Trypanosoma cruzi marinkellei]